MSPMVIAIAVAVAVSMLAVVGFMVYRDYAGEKTLDDRLDRLTGAKTPTLEAAGILRTDLFPDDERGFAEKFLPSLPSMTRMFEQADLKITATQFWSWTAGLGVVGLIIPLVGKAFLPLWVAPVGALMLGAIPFGYVRFMRSYRLKKVGAQLCEALELVARALRAGHSLAAGMHVVADEMPAPISTEFGRVYEEQNLGLSIEQAMRNLAERVPNLDLKFFVTAVIIQRQTGGDLAEILDKIGYLIRERFKLYGMVKALTAEGRLSGVILIALPFVLLFVLLALNPEYVSLLWTTEMGRKMSAGAIVLMILGALIIRKIINIEV